ncbi:MAG: hypothetical protein INQ03_16335 [Candidatus Heimdallarchaeota archaeon]|nr:hypothetical protein [Candidatus Heimdallarchaeota archaeon]
MFGHSKPENHSEWKLSNPDAYKILEITTGQMGVKHGLGSFISLFFLISFGLSIMIFGIIALLGDDQPYLAILPALFIPVFIFLGFRSYNILHDPRGYLLFEFYLTDINLVVLGYFDGVFQKVRSFPIDSQIVYEENKLIINDTEILAASSSEAESYLEYCATVLSKKAENLKS